MLLWCCVHIEKFIIKSFFTYILNSVRVVRCCCILCWVYTGEQKRKALSRYNEKGKVSEGEENAHTNKLWAYTLSLLPLLSSLPILMCYAIFSHTQSTYLCRLAQFEKKPFENDNIYSNSNQHFSDHKDAFCKCMRRSRRTKIISLALIFLINHLIVYFSLFSFFYLFDCQKLYSTFIVVLYPEKQVSQK